MISCKRQSQVLANLKVVIAHAGSADEAIDMQSTMY